MMTESFKIAIFGDQYSVRSDLPAETITRAAGLVDSVMKEIANNGMRDIKSVAVLAALRLAHQLDAVDQCSGCIQDHEKLCTFIDQELAKLNMHLDM